MHEPIFEEDQHIPREERSHIAYSCRNHKSRYEGCTLDIVSLRLEHYHTSQALDDVNDKNILSYYHPQS